MVQFCSVALSCLTLCDPKDYSDPKSLGSRTAARQASLCITNSRSLLKLMSIESVMPSNHLTLSSPSPPALNLSQHQGLFQWVRSSHQVANHWHFSLNISPSNEYSGLISFRMDWLDLLAVQRTLKSLLQYHSSKRTAQYVITFGNF